MTVLALYTTIYPGVERFLRDWFRSVEAQTDRQFQLWIGLDSLTVDSVIEAMGADPHANFVTSKPGDSPAQVRQRALEQIVQAHEGVIFVDSDDRLHPTRVAAAREALGQGDLSACALRLVNEHGADLHIDLTLPPDWSINEILPRNNIFGLSNTVYRCTTLSSCLPIPPAVSIVDWFLATRAWQLGAQLHFDRSIRMEYRQHGANMVRTVPPFDAPQVKADTVRALNHFALIRSARPSAALPERTNTLSEVAEDIARFQRFIERPEALARYVAELNRVRGSHVWWSSVANQALSHLWADS